MQRRAVIWILRMFHTLLSLGIKAIAGLIPIYLHLQKLSSIFQLRMHMLPPNHIVKSLLESRHMNVNSIHWLLLKRLMPRQQLLLKVPIVDANNRLNEIFPSFDPFNNEFSPGDRLIDIFPSYFSLHSINRRNKESIKVHIYKLDKITFQVSLDFKIAVIISNASIKNQVTTFIIYIHTHNSLVIRTIYYIINIMLTEVELFAIRCGINQAICLSNINQIIVITDSIHTAKKIFNLLNHLYQIQLLLISRELRDFFIKDHSNFIKFHDCPSCKNWTLYNLVNKEIKDFDRKCECNKILNK